MSDDQTNKKPKYYIKLLDRKGGAPNWAVYERTEAGTRAIALCYDEETARLIMRLMEDAKRKT